jgi:hypothetical protein
MDNFLQDLLRRAIDAAEFFKGKTNALLKKWVIPLTVAGEQTVEMEGNFIYGIEATDSLANVNVQFSRRESDIDQHNVVKALGYVHPFDKLHFSWAAQPGKTITLLIGNLAPELLSIIDNRSNIASDALLTAILAELTGSVAAGNFGTVQVSNAAATQIRPALATRKSIVIQNLSGNTGNLYLGFANTVAATVCFICLTPGQAWTCDDYCGAVWGLQTVLNDRATYGEAI